MRDASRTAAVGPQRGRTFRCGWSRGLLIVGLGGRDYVIVGVALKPGQIARCHSFSGACPQK